jgi:soluble lytic murein transglycosylase-like protein
MNRSLASALLCSGLAVASMAQAAHAAGRNPSEGVRPTDQSAAALTLLAQRYDRGDGIDQDFRKANTLYCSAARAGDAEAQFRLGWIYASGRGVTRDTGVAAALFAMAADQGHEYARRRLQYFPIQPHTLLPACLLGRSVVVDTKARRQVESLVRKLAPQYAIDPALALAVIAVESGFNATAVSHKNAQGLMQLIPETAERFGVRKALDPSDNIKGGLAYLRWLMALFRGDVKLVLAAYNAGERAVEQYRGIPPFEETRNYVQRISLMYGKARHPYDPHVVKPSPITSLQ